MAHYGITPQVFIASHKFAYRPDAWTRYDDGPYTYGATLHERGHLGAIPAHYGAETSDEGLTAQTTALVQAASVFAAEQGNTPEELRARIATLKQRKKQWPWLAKTIDARIIRLQGRLAATVREEGETAQWRNLGQVGIGVGILMGVAIIGVALDAVARSRAR